MIRKLSLLLAILTLGSTAVSCGDASDTIGEDVTADQTSQQAVETQPEPEVPNYLTLENDFGGAEFMVLGMENPSYSQFTNFEIYAEEETGDIVNDAVLRRNQTIEEQYNVKIAQHLAEIDQAQTNTKHFQYIQTQILSGEDSFDIMFTSLRDAGAVISNKFTVDMYELPYIDFDEEYWNQNTTNDKLEINGKLMLTNSDFSLVDKKRTYILIYNRDLHKEYSDIVIEDKVRDGTWTYDMFSELVRSMSTDVDGNGTINYEDQWGIVMDSWHGYHALAIGMGGSTVSKDSSGNMVVNANSERMVDIISLIHELLVADKNNGFFATQHPWTIPGVANSSANSSYVFNDGRALFSTSFPQSLASLSSKVEFDYGVLTWPKYDESQQDYYAFADKFGCVLFGVPITNPDTDMAGFMLEVLSGYSTDTTLEAYYETSCKIKHVYDETSAEMLDIAMGGIIYDLGAIMDFGGIYDKVITQIHDDTANTYVSDVEAILPKIQASIDELIETLS